MSHLGLDGLTYLGYYLCAVILVTLYINRPGFLSRSVMCDSVVYIYIYRIILTPQLGLIYVSLPAYCKAK